MQTPKDASNESPKLTRDQRADELQRIGLNSLNRYAGRPDLLLKEHPHRDYRKYAKEHPPAK